MAELIVREDKNGTATLYLNRPEKLNSLNGAIFRALGAHLDQIALQTGFIGLVIVRGAGRCFSVGRDLDDIEGGGGALPRYNFEGHIVEKLASLPQPVICAIHGHCYTGALELALAGDLIFAAESAQFADLHGRLDMAPMGGGSQRLPRRIGSYKAREMFFTGKTYSGPEALAMGLANFCVPDDELDTELELLAETVLTNSWFSNQAYKKLLLDTDGMRLKEGLAHEAYRGEGRGADMEERLARGLGSKPTGYDKPAKPRGDGAYGAD
jgi:enoyl-CoA hydratase/carnithine racemase